MEAASERLGALLELQRNFGLRFEESAKLDAARALREAEKTGAVSIKDGTKGAGHELFRSPVMLKLRHSSEPPPYRMAAA